MIDVACAVIVNAKGRVLATKRSATMAHPLKWEFPGGKVEAGEIAETALLREIKEELGVTIEILQALPSTTFGYSSIKKVYLLPFVCRITEGDIHLAEHEEYRWLKPADLFNLTWVEADIPVVKAVQNYINY